MTLPKRHRNHRLETESVRKFQLLIPSLWVYRTPTDDYGIDGEIEVFDKDGLATGKKFLLQLKATDEENLNKALKLRLPLEKVNYFNKLNLPVLVVRYIAFSNDIYIRWFHSFDSYYESTTKKSISFNFSNCDMWYEGREKRLENELDEYLNFSNNKNVFPIHLPIFFAPDFPLANEVAKFVSNIIEKSKKYKYLIQLEFLQKKDILPPTYVLFDSVKLHVVLSNKTGSCLHFKDGLGDKKIENIATDLFIAIALSLYFRGYKVESSHLFIDHIKLSTLKYNEKVISAVITGLIQARQSEKLLDLAEYLFSSDEGINRAQLVLVSIINCFDRSDISEVKLLLETLSKISASLQIREIYDLAGIIEYNHGNILRTYNNDFKEAIKHYNKAAKFYSEYKNKAYWYSEIAGCLFLLKRFSFSSMYYKTSITIEFNINTQALYADALMYSGQFKRSLEEFHYLFEKDESDHFKPEWELKVICLHNIVDILKIKAQFPSRNSYDIEKLITADDDSFIDHLKNKDILCGEVWFHLGISLIKSERYDDATFCFIMSAFTEYSEMDSWCNALTCSFEIENQGMIESILQYTFERFGQDFLLYFFETKSYKEGSDPVEIQLMLVDMMQQLNDINSSPQVLEVRMHNLDRSFDRIVSIPS